MRSEGKILPFVVVNMTSVACRYCQLKNLRGTPLFFVAAADKCSTCFLGILDTALFFLRYLVSNFKIGGMLL